MFLIALYLINLYIRPQDWVPILLGWPVDYLIIIPALLLGFTIQSKNKFVRIPQFKLLVALLIIIILSDIINGNAVLGVTEFVLFAKKMCIFLMIILLVNSIGKLKNIMFFLIMLSSFIAVQAIFQFSAGGVGLAGQDFYHSGTGVRTMWVGLWNGANAMSLLLNIAMPFALEFAFGNYSVLYKLINFLFTGCLIFGIYTTNSRGGFVALLMILFLYPIMRLKKKKVALIIGVSLVLIMLLFFSPSRMSEVSSQEASAHERTRLWSNAIELFRDNMLLGAGKGQYILVTARHMLAHSNFMQNLAEIGGIGIFVWVALIYFSFKGLYQIYKIEVSPGTKEQKLRSLAIALFVSLVGFNLSTLFVTNEIDIFYLLLGLCAGAVNIMNKEIHPVEIKFTLKDARNIFGIIVFMTLFYYVQTI